MFCISKKWKYVQLIFRIPIVKKNNFFNDTKCRKRRMALSCSKKISPLLHRMTSRHKNGSCCLNCLHCFRMENKLKSHEKVCKNKDFCRIVMPSQNYNLISI